MKKKIILSSLAFFTLLIGSLSSCQGAFIGSNRPSTPNSSEEEIEEKPNLDEFTLLAAKDRVIKEYAVPKIKNLGSNDNVTIVGPYYQNGTRTTCLFNGKVIDKKTNMEEIHVNNQLRLYMDNNSITPCCYDSFGNEIPEFAGLTKDIIQKKDNWLTYYYMVGGDSKLYQELYGTHSDKKMHDLILFKFVPQNKYMVTQHDDKYFHVKNFISLDEEQLNSPLVSNVLQKTTYQALPYYLTDKLYYCFEYCEDNPYDKVKVYKYDNSFNQEMDNDLKLNYKLLNSRITYLIQNIHTIDNDFDYMYFDNRYRIFVSVGQKSSRTKFLPEKYIANEDNTKICLYGKKADEDGRLSQKYYTVVIEDGNLPSEPTLNVEPFGNNICYVNNQLVKLGESTNVLSNFDDICFFFESMDNGVYLSYCTSDTEFERLLKLDLNYLVYEKSSHKVNNHYYVWIHNGTKNYYLDFDINKKELVYFSIDNVIDFDYGFYQKDNSYYALGNKIPDPINGQSTQIYFHDQIFNEKLNSHLVKGKENYLLYNEPITQASSEN